MPGYVWCIRCAAGRTGKSAFKLPHGSEKADAERLEWAIRLDLMRQMSLIDKTWFRSGKVCEDHFNPDDLRLSKGGRKFLNRGALPLTNYSTAQLDEIRSTFNLKKRLELLKRRRESEKVPKNKRAKAGGKEPTSSTQTVVPSTSKKVDNRSLPSSSSSVRPRTSSQTQAEHLHIPSQATSTAAILARARPQHDYSTIPASSSFVGSAFSFEHGQLNASLAVPAGSVCASTAATRYSRTVRTYPKLIVFKQQKPQTAVTDANVVHASVLMSELRTSKVGGISVTEVEENDPEDEEMEFIDYSQSSDQYNADKLHIKEEPAQTFSDFDEPTKIIRLDTEMDLESDCKTDIVHHFH